MIIIKKNMNTINGNIIDNQINENKKDNVISKLNTPSETSEGKFNDEEKNNMKNNQRKNVNKCCSLF